MLWSVIHLEKHVTAVSMQWRKMRSSLFLLWINHLSWFFSENNSYNGGTALTNTTVSICYGRVFGRTIGCWIRELLGWCDRTPMVLVFCYTLKLLVKVVVYLQASKGHRCHYWSIQKVQLLIANNVDICPVRAQDESDEGWVGRCSLQAPGCCIFSPA